MRKLTLIAALTGLALPAFADDAALLMGVSRYDEFRRVSNGLDVLSSADALRDAGLPVVANREQAWLDFKGWRVNYDEVLLMLARMTMAPYAPWSSDRSTRKMQEWYGEKQ